MSTASTGVILAIDLGKFHSQACFYNLADGSHEFVKLASTPKAMHELLTSRPVDRVVIEVGAQAGWVVDLCRTLGIEVQVACANGEAWRWKNVKYKSDRQDALKLARLSANNELTLVHVPAKDVRQWRSLMQYRHKLVERRTAVRNSIHALLAVQGDQAVIRNWSGPMVDELKKLGKPLKKCGADDLWRGQLDLELRMMEEIGVLIEEAEAKLDALAAQDSQQGRRVRLLQTIPGVGPRLAEMVVAWIDDPGRFATGRQVGSYAGLTPRRYQSGQSDRHGRISKAGCGRLRKLLVQVAWGMLQHNERGKAVFARLCKGHKTRRKQAAVALARKVLVWCWAMLRDNKPWDEKQQERRQSELAEAALAEAALAEAALAEALAPA
jgi:transposase